MPLATKRRFYAHDAGPHLRHLDARAKTLEVFVLQDQNWLLTDTPVDEEEACAPPFDAITFSLGLLWPFDPPSTETPSDEPA